MSISNYVIKLIENLPEPPQTTQKIDLILDGGIFNGSYLVGALYFLQEMENRKYISIERISGCSIGSLVAFLYYIDGLDVMPQLYEIITKNFKKNYTLRSIKHIKTYLHSKLPEQNSENERKLCEKINGKLYICFYNVEKRQKIIKHQYKNVDDVIDTIIKSCFVPFLIDHTLIYKRKYMDGINAFIFNNKKDSKTLHLELFGYDKFSHALNIKNEKINFHRVLSGLLDAHNFFVKQTNTSMCSYVEDWTLFHKIHYNCKLVIEYFFMNVIYIFYYIQTHFSNNIYDFLITKIICRIIYDIFTLTLEEYCL